MAVKATVEKVGSFDIDKISAGSAGIEMTNAPEGYVKIHENRHLWSKARIGEMRSDGQFDVVALSPTSSNLIRSQKATNKPFVRAIRTGFVRGARYSFSPPLSTGKKANSWNSLPAYWAFLTAIQPKRLELFSSCRALQG